jgi:tetratricopeptide (TPR) repeat protein
VKQSAVSGQRSAMGPIIVIILVFIISGKVTFSQKFFEGKRYDIDSLQQVLIKATGAERVRTLCLIAWQCRIDEADKSVTLAEEAYQLSRGTDDPKIDLLATYTIGLAYHHSGDYPKAIRYSMDAKEMAEKQNDTISFYQIMHCIVFSYLYSNNHDLAIRYTHAAFDYLISWNQPYQEFEKYIRLGWIYMVTGNYRAAIPYFLKAAEYAELTELVPRSKMALNYFHTTGCYLQLEKYDSAMFYINLGDRTCRENDLDFSDFSLSYKGDYYFLTKNYDSAAFYYQEALNNARNRGDLSGQATNLSDLGSIFKLRRELEKAIGVYKEMIEKAAWIREKKSYFLDRSKTHDYWYTAEQSVPQYIERFGLRMQMNGHKNLFEIYKSLSDDKNALQHLEAYNEAADRNRELDRKNDVTEINTRYETERKEQQILLLTSENELNAINLEQTRYFLFALAGFILLVILVAIMLIRQNRMKALQDKTILEQRLLRAQMNPHFLFNTLSNIQSYMLENDMARASHYLSRFSKLMRNILDNTARESVPLEQEISTIENYLELQMIRYQGRFEYTIYLDDRIDPEGTFIPPMLAQPFIENAIEHGIKHRKKKGLISIRFTAEDKSNSQPQTSYNPDVLPSYSLICIEVTDNGIGRGKSEQIEHEQSRHHRPMATSITRERLRILSRKVRRNLRRKINLEIVDLFDENGNPAGTRVEIVIPVDHPEGVHFRIPSGSGKYDYTSNPGVK